MNADAVKQPRCPACRSTDLTLISYQRQFRPHGKVVVVDLLALHCASCGAESTRSAQHNENLARMKARKAEYGGLLLGEEILALRRRYGITQQQAAKVFGKGKIAFSRYENETSYPDESTTKLLKVAIQKPDVLKLLADDAGVELPLWDARCADERGVKLRMIFEGEPDWLVQRWAERRLALGSNRANREDLLWPLANGSGGEVMDDSSANDGHYHSAEAA